MDNCFAPCGCDGNEGITKSDLDRFTDTIENVLNDEKGRRLFRNFMYTSKFKAGRRALDFWEHNERLLGYKENEENVSYRSYLRDVDSLIKEADKIDDIDLATMERLTITRDSENKDAIIEALKLLKVQVMKALKGEYNAFRRHYGSAK